MQPPKRTRKENKKSKKAEKEVVKFVLGRCFDEEVHKHGTKEMRTKLKAFHILLNCRIQHVCIACSVRGGIEWKWKYRTQCYGYGERESESEMRKSCSIFLRIFFHFHSFLHQRERINHFVESISDGLLGARFLFSAINNVLLFLICAPLFSQCAVVRLANHQATSSTMW